MEIKIRTQHELAVHLTKVEGLKEQVNVAQMTEIVSQIVKDNQLAFDLLLLAIKEAKKE